jgi:hypothetical protein
MPREKDLLGTIEAQARHVLGLIESEIADLEERVSKLREQHARWSSVLVGSPPPPLAARRRRSKVEDSTPPKARRKAAPKPVRAPGPSIDWNEVLKELPGRFSMADIATATPALDPNPRARIVAIARWTRAKQVKKVATGQYEKVTERARKRADAATGAGAVAAESHEHDAEGQRRSGTDPEIETPAA